MGKRGAGRSRGPGSGEFGERRRAPGGAPPTPRAGAEPAAAPRARVSRRFQGPGRAGLRLSGGGGEAGKRRAGQTRGKAQKGSGRGERETNYTVPSSGTQVPSPQSGSGFLPSGRRPAGGQDRRFGGCVPPPPLLSRRAGRLQGMLSGSQLFRWSPPHGQVRVQVRDATSDLTCVCPHALLPSWHSFFPSLCW